MIDLSIILPTCNRAHLLKQALDAILLTTHCRYEVIVVNGASTDDTARVLLDARHRFGDALTVVDEPLREGFVKAANRGFRRAVGRNMTWINDDARPLPGALDLAVEQSDRAGRDVAFLAMFHRWHSAKNIAFQTDVHPHGRFSLCHIRGTLYANFPVGRRETFERLGLFDERFRFCAADPDLSLKAWHAGLRVEPAWGCCLDHDEHADDRRAADASSGVADNELLFRKWTLPPRNPRHNDFDPHHPCTLRGLATPISIAA